MRVCWPRAPGLDGMPASEVLGIQLQVAAASHVCMARPPAVPPTDESAMAAKSTDTRVELWSLRKSLDVMSCLLDAGPCPAAAPPALRAPAPALRPPPGSRPASWARVTGVLPMSLADSRDTW